MSGSPISREELFGQLLAEGFGLRSIGLALARGIRRGGIVVVKAPAGYFAHAIEGSRGRVVRDRYSPKAPPSTATAGV